MTFLTETLFPTVLNMSLTASAVILVVLLARFLLRRAPKVFSYALWAVVLFRLLCPVSLTAGISLFGAVDAPVRAATPGISTVEYLPAVRENLTTGAEETPATPAVPVMPVTDPEPVTPAVSSSQGEPVSVAKPALPSLSEVAAWGWLTGVVLQPGLPLPSAAACRGSGAASGEYLSRRPHRLPLCYGDSAAQNLPAVHSFRRRAGLHHPSRAVPHPAF